MAYPLVTINGSFTIGDGTEYEITGPITGLGVPPLRTNDVTRGHQDGQVGANDYLDVRVISIPVAIEGGSPDECWTNVAALQAAWQPSDVDIPLQIKLTESVVLTYRGRPGAAGQSPCDVDLQHLYRGEASAVLLFRVLDSGGLDT